MKLSRHVIEEREERMVFILSHEELSADFTSVIEVPFIKEDKRECLTKSGVIFVKALREEFLITAYVPTIDKVYAMYKVMGMEMPYSVKRTVIRNKKYVGKF